MSDDYRLFCGDLGNEVNDDVLSKAFARFPTFNMAKVKCVYLSSFSGFVMIHAWFTMNICLERLHMITIIVLPSGWLYC